MWSFSKAIHTQSLCFTNHGQCVVLENNFSSKTTHSKKWCMKTFQTAFLQQLIFECTWMSTTAKFRQDYIELLYSGKQPQKKWMSKNQCLTTSWPTYGEDVHETGWPRQVTAPQSRVSWREQRHNLKALVPHRPTSLSWTYFKKYNFNIFHSYVEVWIFPSTYFFRIMVVVTLFTIKRATYE